MFFKTRFCGEVMLFLSALSLSLFFPSLILAAEGNTPFGLPAILTGAASVVGLGFGWIGAMGRYGRLIRESVEAYQSVMKLVVSAEYLIKSAPAQLKENESFIKFMNEMDDASEEVADVLDLVGRRDAARFLRDLIKSGTQEDIEQIKKRLTSTDPVLAAGQEVLRKMK